MHVGHCGNHIYIYKWCSHAAVAPSPGNFGMVAGLIECNQSCWAPACVSALSTADMASRALRFALRKALCSLRASRIGSEAVTPCSVCKVFTTALQKLFVKRGAATQSNTWATALVRNEPSGNTRPRSMHPCSCPVRSSLLNIHRATRVARHSRTCLWVCDRHTVVCRSQMAARVKFEIAHIRAHGNCDLFFWGCWI